MGEVDILIELNLPRSLSLDMTSLGKFESLTEMAVVTGWLVLPLGT